MLDDARDLARSRAISLDLNYPERPDRCLRIELTLVVHVAQVFVDGPNVLAVQGTKTAPSTTRPVGIAPAMGRHALVGSRNTTLTKAYRGTSRAAGPTTGGPSWTALCCVIRNIAAILALTLCCTSAAEGKPLTKSRMVTWSRGSSMRGVRFWFFRNDVKKGQTFGLFDRNGLVTTAKVVGFEQPYDKKPCFRIALAEATRVPDGTGLVAYGPLDEAAPKAHVVDVRASDAPATNRRVVGLDLDGDGQADLAFAGRDCPDAHGYDWCIDSYVRTKAGWSAVEHYFDAEGCLGKK